MNFCVYILYSQSHDKFYIGQTSNFENRLHLHNSGLVFSTKPYLPWLNELIIEKEKRSEAMVLEKKLKNLNKERLKAFIDKYK